MSVNAHRTSIERACSSGPADQPVNVRSLAPLKNGRARDDVFGKKLLKSEHQESFQEEA
jgi:hypothetical protein